MKKILGVLLFLSLTARAIVYTQNNTAPVLIIDDTYTPIGHNNPLDVIVTPGGTQPITGTVTVQQSDGTQLHTTIDNSSLAITASSLPLPLGAATSALQTTGNTSLSSIASAVSGTLSVQATSLPLPSNAAQESGGHLASIDSKLTSPLAVTGTVTATNAANGSAGATAPTQATQVAGSDGTNLQVLKVSSAGVLSVDNSANTQPISAVSLPLPTGGATSALQSTGNSSLSSILSALQGTLSTSVTNLPASQTVNQATGSNLHTVIDSGALTANIGTTNGVALDTSIQALQVAQGSTTASQKGSLVQAAVSSSAPSYTTAQTSPLSLTLAGALRVDGSAVTQPISAASLPLPTGGATSALQTSGNTTLSTISTQLPATLGGKTTANAMAVSIASDQTVPISATSLPLPTGGSTSALQSTANTTLSAISGQLPASLGAKATAASMAVNIASDQTVPVNVTSSVLPTGGSTSANQSSQLTQETTSAINSGTIVTNTGNTATNTSTTATNTGTISSQQTSGAQKTQLVDGSGNVYGPSQNDGTGIKALPVQINFTNFVFSANNTSTAQLAAGATFTGTIDNIIAQQAYSILLTSDQNGTLTVNQCIDSACTRIAQSLAFSVIANQGFSRSGVINGNYFYLTFKNNGASTTTTLNINTAYGTLPSSTQYNNQPVSINEINGTQLTAVGGGIGVSTNISSSGTPTQTSVSCGTSSTTLLAASSATHFISLRNPTTATVTVWVNIAGASAVTAAPSLDLPPGGELDFTASENSYLPTSQINCIASSASSLVVVYK